MHTTTAVAIQGFERGGLEPLAVPSPVPAPPAGEGVGVVSCPLLAVVTLIVNTVPAAPNIANLPLGPRWRDSPGEVGGLGDGDGDGDGAGDGDGIPNFFLR